MPIFRALQRPQLWSTSGYVCRSCRHELLIARGQFSRSQANLSPTEGAGGDDWFSNFNDLSTENYETKQVLPQKRATTATTGRENGNNDRSAVPEQEDVAKRYLDRPDGVQTDTDTQADRLSASLQTTANPSRATDTAAGQLEPPSSPSTRERKKLPKERRKPISDQARRERNLRRVARFDAAIADIRARKGNNLTGDEKKSLTYYATQRGLALRAISKLEAAAKLSAGEAVEMRAETNNGDLGTNDVSTKSSGKESASVPPTQLENESGTASTTVAESVSAESRRQLETTLIGLSKKINDKLTALWSGETKSDLEPSPQRNLDSQATNRLGGHIKSTASALSNISDPSKKLSSRSSADELEDQLEESLPWWLKTRPSRAHVRPVVTAASRESKLSPPLAHLKSSLTEELDDESNLETSSRISKKSPAAAGPPVEDVDVVLASREDNGAAVEKFSSAAFEHLSTRPSDTKSIDENVHSSAATENAPASKITESTSSASETQLDNEEAQSADEENLRSVTLSKDAKDDAGLLALEAKSQRSRGRRSTRMETRRLKTRRVKTTKPTKPRKVYSDSLSPENLRTSETSNADSKTTPYKPHGPFAINVERGQAPLRKHFVADTLSEETVTKPVESSADLKKDPLKLEVGEASSAVGEKADALSKHAEEDVSALKKNNAPRKRDSRRPKQNNRASTTEAGHDPLAKVLSGHELKKRGSSFLNSNTSPERYLSGLESVERVFETEDGNDPLGTNTSEPEPGERDFTLENSNDPMENDLSKPESGERGFTIENSNVPSERSSDSNPGEEAYIVESADAPPQNEPARGIDVRQSLAAQNGMAAVARSESSMNDEGGGNSGNDGDDGEHKSLWEVMNKAQVLVENTPDHTSQVTPTHDVVQATAPDQPSLDLSSSDAADVFTIKPSDLVVEPLNISQPPVPGLEYGLDRVLFNPGVYQLQDPHSRVYNFDPYLQKIMPVVEFDFNALKEYKTSSQDNILSALAKEHGKRYIGSTSSMTGMLGHFHYLLSAWRPLNLGMFSRGFPDKLDSFTLLNRAPNAIFLRWKNGTYAIDADKEYDSGNVLMLLGKSMEKLLTMPTSEYERYRKSDPRTVSEEERTAPEAFQYTTMGDFLMRSQLDAYDPRLPGTGMFDLKTRAVLTVRMNADDFQPMTGYEIHSLQGRFKSYEREHYDMIRSTMLKYMLQARMGRMDGIFVAYHNVERIFGFQYIPVQEMDRAIHGQFDRCLGDQEFKISLALMNKLFDKATAKFPEQSLRFHFETTTDSLGSSSPTTVMWIFAEPQTDAEIDVVQAKSKAKVAEFERTMMGVERPAEQTDMAENEGVDNPADEPANGYADLQIHSDSKAPSLQSSDVSPSNSSDLNTSDSEADIEFIDSLASASSEERKPLFAASLICTSRVNGVPVERPANLKPDDVWEVEYILREWDAPEAMWMRYDRMKARRKELFERYRNEEESPDGSENGNGNGELTSRQKREKAFINFLKSMSESGRDFRNKLDQLEAGKEPVVLGQDIRTAQRVAEEEVGDVDEYVAWLYGNGAE